LIKFRNGYSIEVGRYAKVLIERENLFMHRITSIHFKNYKSFKNFSISLNKFNILVGPNNAGKSTIIGSLKLLSEGIRKARSKRPVPIRDPKGLLIKGYQIDLQDVPIATENVFCDYNDGEPAIIRFRLSNGNHLQIFFPEKDVCYMNCESVGKEIESTIDFKTECDIDIGYVPVLGPVEHKEPLYQKEAARRALLSYTASRNFRNIWLHFGEDFESFRESIKSTWPGMDINYPEVDRTADKPMIYMYCPEERIPREIFWAGFGFQVWCQMLTFILKNRSSNIFIIDEPDIYLHSDLQRQLLMLLKALGPDIIIATHSTEIISEAELNDILLINKSMPSAKRIKDPSELQRIFYTLGSNLNPTLTQVAKCRRVLFVEGKDFSILSKLARKGNFFGVANRSDFAVIPLEGFNPARLKAFKQGIEKTIGSRILSSVIFDRDYRSENEVKTEIEDLCKDNYFAVIHSLKELENFLIIPSAIEAAIQDKIDEQNARGNSAIVFDRKIEDILLSLSDEFKNKTRAQLQSHRLKIEKRFNPKIDDSTLIEETMTEFDLNWGKLSMRLKLLPGKEFLATLNQYLQEHYSISISYSNIIDNISQTMLPTEMKRLLSSIEKFRVQRVP
jgi:energy-coupling factor transporter ATP-binding protein EcfA2